MSTELWLQEPRRVIDEPGASCGVRLGRDEQAVAVASLRRGELSASHLYLDPVAGVALGPPSFDLDHTTAAGWSTTGVGWADETAQPTPFGGADGHYAKAMAFRADGAWSLSSKEPFGWGEPLVLRFLAYPRMPAAAGDALTITFGGPWRLCLAVEGQARLERRDSAGTYRAVASFQWLASRWAPAEHGLWIWEVGPKLVVRPIAALERPDLGVAWWDETAAADPARELPAGAEPVLHALRASPVGVAGQGFIVVGCSRQTFVPGTTSLEQVQPRSIGVAGEGSTAPVTIRLAGLHTDGVTSPAVTPLDGNETPWPVGLADQQRRYQLRWRAEWPTTATSTYYLASLDLSLPQRHRWSGQTGTNVLAWPQVADQQIALSREGDLSREHIDVRLFASGVSLAPYVQPNMALRYVVDGVTRFRGYSEHAEWNALCDPGFPVGTLQLTGSGLWSRFRRAVWPGGPAFDGRRLTDCLVSLVTAAGLTEAEYDIVDDPFTLPPAPAGEPPALEYRVGTSIDHILEDLREKFCGQWLALYFRLSDGCFVVERAATGGGSPVAAFYETTALARGAGTPERVVLSGSYEEQLDGSEMANAITVLGQSPGGQCLLARAVDWASIRDTTAPNFVGEVWPMTVADPGLCTQEAVNRVCRSLFERHRAPRVFAQWSSVRVDLFPGDLVQLVGPHYGGLYRLRGMVLQQASAGDAAAPAGRASYSGERVA